MAGLASRDKTMKRIRELQNGFMASIFFSTLKMPCFIHVKYSLDFWFSSLSFTGHRPVLSFSHSFLRFVTVTRKEELPYIQETLKGIRLKFHHCFAAAYYEAYCKYILFI